MITGAMILAAVIYMVPFLVGLLKGHNNLGGLFFLNLLLGWSGLGWVGSLIWACVGKAG